MSQVTSQNALVKDSTLQTLNNKLDTINNTIGGNTNIAPVFNTAAAYSKGDMVNYNGILYVFTSNHAAGAWTGNDVIQTNVGSEINQLKSGLIGVAAKVPIRGSFTVLCSIGNNVFSRNTMDLVAGSIPQSPFNNCIMMIVNHGSNNATNDTIQVDGANEIIINAQIEQNITVAWLDISNIPIVDS